MASSHHPTAEQLGNTAVIELDDSQRIIPVIVLAQLRRHSRDTNRGNGLDNRVLTKKPQRQINVMDRAVDEDSTRELRVFDKETARIELVAGLRTEDARATDKTGLHLIECITVGGIEAATETADDLLRGVGFLGGAVSVDYCLALFRSVSLLQLDDIRVYGHTSSTLVLNGFSQRTCRPLLIALMACSACTLVAEATTTACSDGSDRSISS